MRIDEIRKRKEEIRSLVNGDAQYDVDAITEELRSLNAEENEIMERNKKEMELRAAITAEIAPTIIEKETIEMSETRTFAVDTVEYRNAFLKNLMGKDLDTEERAAITASAAIPTQTMNEIIHKLELAPIINAVDVSYIPGNVSYPVEGNVAAASWVAMGNAATDSADAINAITLGAYKLIKTVEITADVAAMAVDAFEAWLVARLANKIERAVAIAIVSGTGSAQATGLSSLAETGTYTKVMTFHDVMAMIAALPTEYSPNASFVMSRATFYGNVLNIQDSTKRPIVVADAQAPAKFNVMGYPVILEDAAGTDVYFGDFKEGYKFNFAKAPTVDRDESVAFRTGSTVYRAMALADGKPTGKGIVRYTAGS